MGTALGSLALEYVCHLSDVKRRKPDGKGLLHLGLDLPGARGDGEGSHLLPFAHDAALLVEVELDLRREPDRHTVTVQQGPLIRQGNVADVLQRKAIMNGMGHRTHTTIQCYMYMIHNGTKQIIFYLFE